MMTPVDFNFANGAVYSRRTDIHARFGGQAQSGISTPADVPAVFMFTGGGADFGCQDGLDERGVFLYAGEGQVGDVIDLLAHVTNVSVQTMKIVAEIKQAGR